ncbi:MAG: hypothetical protein DVB31_13950 [Verrucomicrobia bacterium]|nr:MAG: hypothetical protein DVB31_13950 [Verrucomicrobiota bacterium]
MKVSAETAGPPVSKTFQFVQAVVSPRARGLSVRLNMNPDGFCNFDCVYCDVDRCALRGAVRSPHIGTMLRELEEVLEIIAAGGGGTLPGCEGAPKEYLRLGHVALSGNGEPTLCPLFEEIVEAVLHLRALGHHGFFKVALITNSSGLMEPPVRRGLALMTAQDEVWAKLDAGTPEWFRAVNRTEVPFDDILKSIRETARQRPVVIQSLFPRMNGKSVPLLEQDAYAACLAGLRNDGALIELVQIYSASRPPAGGRCGHATLAELSAIARRVKEVAGLPAHVF